MEKTSEAEVCPKCARLSHIVYDRRWICLRDAPLRAKRVMMHVHKRRFYCRTCNKPFTEPIAGVRKASRTTERYRKSLLWACETFSDLKSVYQTYRCSAGFLYKTLYAELARKQRARQAPWPKVIGLDEHFFRHLRYSGAREFASLLIDYKNRRAIEVVEGKSCAEMTSALAYIPKRENVNLVVLDLCDPYKKFVSEFFPNAKIVADKFHVIRLLHPAINRRRKEITGDRRNLPVRRLLLRNGFKLDQQRRFLLRCWLKDHPQLQEVYLYKEAIHRLYRVRGYGRAKKVLTKLTDQMADSTLPEIKTLRRTLLAWRKQILAYFHFRITNGRTEGFNNKAKLVKRRAYGYKSFQNYRLRLLNACA